jgi:hypothetical protein
MISIAIASAISLAMLQGAIAAPRAAFMDCLKRTSLTAAAQKVAPAAYADHARQACAAQAESFKSALISFDVKNGIKRAQATTDAQLQVDDFVANSAEKYETKVGGGSPQ